MDSNSLRVIVFFVALVMAVVWSLIALSLFSMWALDLERQLPDGIISISLGIIAFVTVLVLISGYVLGKQDR